MKIFIVCITICITLFSTAYAAKEVYYPVAFTTVEALKDWSSNRMYESDNFVVFWGPKVGVTPTNPPDSVADLAFNPATICGYLENSYAKFITEIGFVSDDASKNLGKYKIVVIINDTWIGDGAPTGWAFGGGYEGVIGAMWVHPGAVKDGLVISHEFAHTLQMMINIQENVTGGGFTNNDFSGFFWESHANYMRCQEYPIMAEDDMPRWLATRMMHWSSTRHHYGSYHTLFTIQELYGISMVNRLWKESVTDEHPLVTLARLQGWSQVELNDFMYNNVKREVIFDWSTNSFGSIMRAKRDTYRNYNPDFMWREYTMLDIVDDVDNRYVVNSDWAPQDYGVNIIPLHSTCDKNSIIKVKFKGHETTHSNTGWRYGVVAEDSTGTTARYSPIYQDAEHEFSFTGNSGEQLYLVVMGAPQAHKNYVWEIGYPKVNRFPYEVAFENCVPEGYQDGFRDNIKSKFAGSIHPNGGGWVDNSATVDASVYVGENAVVLADAKISGNVRIEDNAWVQKYTVSGNATISGNARAIGDPYQDVSTSIISDNAVVNGNAILQHGSDITDNAVIKGNAIAWASNYSGTAVIGGDAEVGSTSSGVYYQFPHFNNGRDANDGKDANDVSNIDINSDYSLFGELYIDDTVGCGAFTSVNQHDLLQNDYLRLYPNPVSKNSTLTITYDSSKGNRITLYNKCGKELFYAASKEGKCNISSDIIMKLKRGIYYVKLFDGIKEVALSSFVVVE